MASRKLQVEIIGDSRSLERAFGRSNKATGSLAGGLGKLAKAGIVAGAALGAGLAVGVKKSIDAASNLEEQINKTNVVFRGSQNQVKEWSKGLEQSFGLSQRAALEAAGTYGNMLVPMGLARDQAASMSEVMVELAGDMASFNNASPEDTLKAIQSGLAGQARPLRQYGVFLSAARTEQEAMTETGKKSAKQLTEGEKAIARYNLILKDTADTQGDFARSSGKSLENQLRIVRAQFEDLAASVGTAVLPVVIRLFRFLSGTLIPALSHAGDVLTDFWKGMTNKLAKAPNFRAKVKIVLTGVEGLASQFVDALVSKIESLLPQKRIKFVPNIDAPGLSTVGGGVDWDKVAADMMAALAVAIQQSVALAEALGTAINNAIDKVDWITAGKKMGPGFAEMLGEAVKTLLDPTFWIKNWELTLSIAVVAFGGTIEKFAAQIGVKFSGALVRMVARISPEFAAALGRLMADAGAFGAKVLEKVGALLFRLATAIFGRLTKVAVFIIKVLGVTAAISAIEDFARAAGRKIQEIIDWFKKLPAAIKGVFAGAGTWLYNAGVAIIQGLWDGLKSKWDAVAGWLGGLGGRIRDLKGPPAKDAVLLNDIGQLIMKGLQDGMNVGWTKIEAMLNGLSPKLQTKVGAMISAIQQAISDGQGVFASAFDGLASAALDAFDKVTSQFQTRTEKKIAGQDAARAARDRAQALKEATDALNQARAAQASLTPQEGESPEDFLKRQADAQQAITDAINQQNEARFQIQRAADEKRAAQERTAYENSRDLQRRHFDEQLATLQTKMEKGTITVREFRKRVLGLFEKFDVPFRNAGKVLGGALAEGMQDSFADATVAARRLIEAISAGLAKAKFIVSIEVQSSEPKRRQFGGPVSRGSSYWVGEAGPELFVPSSSGKIVPNGGGGGAMAEIHTNVYIDSTQVATLVRREMLRFEKRNGRTAV